jgi:hypothetical protein
MSAAQPFLFKWRRDFSYRVENTVQMKVQSFVSINQDEYALFRHLYTYVYMSLFMTDNSVLLQRHFNAAKGLL